MKIKELLLIVVLLVLTGVVRCYRLSNPVADWHSWRQVDTSAVSRTFVQKGFDILHPKFEDISNIPSGKDNPQGYRFVEFPLFNIAQASLFLLFHRFPLEVWGRIVTILASMSTVLFIYLLGKKHGGNIVAASGALFYALDPYSIYYGRVILPDPSMVMALMGGIYFFDSYLDSRKKLHYFLAFIFTASAFLFKPYALFWVLPFAYLAFVKHGFGIFKRLELWIFAVLCLSPLIWWRWWISHFPEGIPVSDWLFNGGNIRFTGAYFYWIFAERISKLLLGYWGIALVSIGFLNQRVKHMGFFLSFFLSSLLYLVVIARGNVQHDYYQILIIPTIAFFFGLGIDFVLSLAKTISQKVVTGAVVLVVSLFLLMFGWYQIRDYFNINNIALVHAGEAVDRLTPKDAKVLAPYDGDTTFLYYTNRQGWPAFEHSLEQLHAMGASYMVLVNPKPSDYDIGKQYKIISSTNEYILFDLHKKL